jgi:hypothetical protein
MEKSDAIDHPDGNPALILRFYTKRLTLAGRKHPFVCDPDALTRRLRHRAILIAEIERLQRSQKPDV